MITATNKEIEKAIGCKVICLKHAEIEEIRGKHVVFNIDGKLYWATKNVANYILKNKPSIIFVEYVEFKDESGYVRMSGDWLMAPSRF